MKTSEDNIKKITRFVLYKHYKQINVVEKSNKYFNDYLLCEKDPNMVLFAQYLKNKKTVSIANKFLSKLIKSVSSNKKIVNYMRNYDMNHYEDSLQEAWSQIMLIDDTEFNPLCNFETFFITCAKNVSKNQWRITNKSVNSSSIANKTSNKSSKENDLDESSVEDLLFKNNEMSIEDKSIGKDELNNTLSEILKLCLGEKQTLILAKFYHIEYDEIAKWQQLDPRTIRCRLSRAREKLSKRVNVSIIDTKKRASSAHNVVSKTEKLSLVKINHLKMKGHKYSVTIKFDKTSLTFRVNTNLSKLSESLKDLVIKEITETSVIFTNGEILEKSKPIELNNKKYDLKDVHIISDLNFFLQGVFDMNEEEIQEIQSNLKQFSTIIVEKQKQKMRLFIIDNQIQFKLVF